MKRILLSAGLFLFLFCFAATSFATNGFQLMGIGSTQKGMGGAVTAAPEDAMTAITNPAGMAVIGNRADFNGEAFMPKRSMDFTELPASPFMGPGKQTSGGSELYGIPALGWTAPAFGRDNVFFGGGMYATAGMGVDYDITNAGSGFGDADVFTSIQFWKMQPTLAWKVNEQLALGVGVDFDYQQVEIKEVFEAAAFGAYPSLGAGISMDLGRAIGVYGGGLSLGAIYKVNDMVTVGASYISKQWFPDMKYRLGSGAVNNFPYKGYLADNTSEGTYKLDMQFPQQAAIGVAVKPMDALTVELDVKWINWKDTQDKVKLSGDFTLIDASDALVERMGGAAPTPVTASSIDLPFGWKNQWVFAVGTRYAVNPDLTLRIGYNYAKSPIDEKDVFNNVAFPAIVEQHLGLGLTYNLGSHWAVSGSYMRAFKEELSGKKDNPQAFQDVGFASDTTKTKISLEENSVGVQVSYRF
ncbi:MAG: outer membrane protein transport protein [bacterium]